MTDPGGLDAVALDIARTELGVEVQLQAAAAHALDLRAVAVFFGAMSAGGLAVQAFAALSGAGAFFAFAAVLVAVAGMATAVRAFLPRIVSGLAPSAYKRVEPGQSAADLHARAFARRAEDHSRNANLLRAKAERVRSAVTVTVAAAVLLLIAAGLARLL
ncbi:hypothetical protein [Dactylosporangium matsuzakiense]|nr:hypothetical protein [Dactylosporangium matsuzakiense]UWZ42037.1 hypothetical protein Dmats_31070 [Dactylosporangium matsuzakiense]